MTSGEARTSSGVPRRDQPALVEDVDRAAQRHHQGQVVLDQADAEAVVGQAAEHRGEHLGLLLGLAGRGLVEQQQPRVGHQRPGHLDHAGATGRDVGDLRSAISLRPVRSSRPVGLGLDVVGPAPATP